MPRKHRPEAPHGGTFRGWKHVADLCPKCGQMKVHWRNIDDIDRYWCVDCRWGWQELTWMYEKKTLKIL